MRVTQKNWNAIKTMAVEMGVEESNIHPAPGGIQIWQGEDDEIWNEDGTDYESKIAIAASAIAKAFPQVVAWERSNGRRFEIVTAAYAQKSPQVDYGEYCDRGSRHHY